MENGNDTSGAPPTSTAPPAKNPLRTGIADDKTGEPCAVVIFGASGDLTKRKLMPALYNLAVSRALPSGSAIIGVSRREHSHDDFRRDMKEAITRFSRRKIDQAVWSDFERGVSYVPGIFEDPVTYQKLKAELERVDKERGTRENRLYYLAVPPARLRRHRGAAEGRRAGVRSAHERWPVDTGVVFEKPFGHDLKSALELEWRRRQGVRREAGVPHRPLSRQGDGAEPPRLPLRQLALRATVEPRARRPRADHRRPRRSASEGRREVLRADGGDPRHRGRTTRCSCSVSAPRWSRPSAWRRTPCATRR